MSASVMMNESTELSKVNKKDFSVVFTAGVRYYWINNLPAITGIFRVVAGVVGITTLLQKKGTKCLLILQY